MSYKGKFVPRHPEKYVGNVNNIRYLSLWERHLMVKCDQSPSIIKWGSEECIIPYYSTVHKRVRRYMVDFVIQVKEASGKLVNYLIEVKPFKETRPPKQNKNKARFIKESITYQVNTDKWKAAKQWANEHGFIFKIMTENELFDGKKKR